MGEVHDTTVEVSHFTPLSADAAPLALPPEAELPTLNVDSLSRRGNSADSVIVYHDEDGGWLLQPEALRGPPDLEYYDNIEDHLTHTCARARGGGLGGRPQTCLGSKGPLISLWELGSSV